MRELPEDATYHERLRLGELVVGALEERRDAEAARLVRAARAVRGRRGRPTIRASPTTSSTRPSWWSASGAKEFEDAVEQLGEELHGRVAAAAARPARAVRLRAG